MNNKKIYSMNKRLQLITGILLIFFAASSCKKKPSPEPEQETATVTDVNGNVYKTVKIGDQWWMAEDLRTTKYSDDTPIIKINESADDDWKNSTVGSYCVISNHFLYNWYTMQTSKNIAPEGWRIPSDEDWKKLEAFLGMSSEETNKTNWRGSKEGDKLKIKQTGDGATMWTKYGEVWGTNESGFTALASGFRMFDGTIGDKKNSPDVTTAFYWSSTLHDQEAWYRYLDYKNSNIFRYHGPKAYGFSVRCIKN